MEQGVPFINAGDLINGHIDYHNCKHITSDKFNQLNGAKLKINDIVYCLRGTIGKNGLVNSDANATIASSLVCIRPVKLRPLFLFQILNSSIEERQRKMVDEGAAQPNISATNLKKFLIPVPNDNEQEKIGEVFSKLNHLITLQQRKLEQLMQLKKAMLQQLFVEKNSKLPILRFKNFNGDWKQHKLRELGKIVTGNTPKTSQIENYNSNGIPWITPTDIHSTYTTNSSKHLSNIGKEKARVAPANSLLITCIASIGKNTLIFQESAFNQQINALIPHNNDSSFLLAESNKWSQIMTNLAGQTSMQIINKKDFSEILTEIPDLSEQKIIGSLFTKLNLFITLQQSKIDQLTILKKYLLQKLFI